MLVLLAGSSGGFAVTALLGARVTATTWERFRAETLADDAFVAIPSRPEPEVADELAAMPGVIDATSFVYVAVMLPGVSEGAAFAAADDRLMRTVQRGRLLEGRRADPTRADEIVVNPVMASAARVRAGARVRLEAVGKPGFSMEVTVVGIVVTANDLALNTGLPAALLTPAFLRTHGHEVDVGRVNQFVRLKAGGTGISEFRNRVVGSYGSGGGVLVGDSNQEASGIRNALRLQATSLGLLAAVAAAATVLAVGQALGRHVAVGAADAPVLRSLGMTSRDRALTSALCVALVAVGGAILAVVVAVVASRLVPTGLARQIERDSGLKLDLVALGGGGAALATLVAAVGVRAARRAARVRDEAPSLRPLQGIGGPLGPAASVGVATALGRGSIPSRGPSRSAIAAAVVGVLGVTAAATFAASLDHLLGTPRLYGWSFGAVVGVGGDDPARIDEAALRLSADPGVTRLAVHELDFMTIGDQTVETFVLDQWKGEPIVPTLAAGRAPRGPADIMLGSTTMTDLGVRLGDQVEVAGIDRPVRLKVVGQGIFPVLGEGSTTQAAAISAEAAPALRLEESRGRLVLFDVEPGADPLAVAARHTDLPASPPVPPSEIQNLRLVGSAPWLLAGFLAALATAAVGHALVTSVRAGRRDVAVLRSLGFVRRQARSIVLWQASIIVAVGLAAGLPTGAAAGRWIWNLAVGSTGALVEPVLPVALLILIVPATLLLANLVAAIPAHSAGRLRPAEVLRAE